MPIFSTATPRDLVVGGVGEVQPPQLFSQPPSSSYEICLGGLGSTPQLLDMQVKSEQQLSDRERGKLSNIEQILEKFSGGWKIHECWHKNHRDADNFEKLKSQFCSYCVANFASVSQRLSLWNK